jgi:hypothetical protein
VVSVAAVSATEGSAHGPEGEGDAPPAEAPEPAAPDAGGEPDHGPESEPGEPPAPSGTEPPRAGDETRPSLWVRLEPRLFDLWVGLLVLLAARTFYGAMMTQTSGEWSAPLDDVFIHFDYARSTARGYPFQWSEGNGFSSGNTSVTYPFVLSVGYLLGFREGVPRHLMTWAAAVACLSVFVFLRALARSAEGLGRWARYLVPPAVLSLGALDWTLFSGMENAFHLAVWGATLTLAQGVADTRGVGPRWERAAVLRALAQGLVGAMLFLTRPESAVCVAALAALAALPLAKRFGVGLASKVFLASSVPGAVAAGLQALANKRFTGEWSANGAIAKIYFVHPYMSWEAKKAEYLHFVEYVVKRLAHHHFADAVPWGWIVPVVGLVPLLSRRTRAIALVLWAQVLGWLALVAMNGQVRWQNERYTMAAVAWLFGLFALGLGVLASRTMGGLLGKGRDRPVTIDWVVRSALALALAGSYLVHQLPNFRDQVWFFARASRNIRDQQVTAGKTIARLKAKRVLVGDAGAITFAADVPGLDLIGLGGYRDYPFARAALHGLGASIELIERMPDADRPDVMAIYPSWWGDLPLIFGRRIVGIPVAGNVICGGAEKVLYRADWSPLERASAPRRLRKGERVIDELDVADLVSEREHGYSLPQPGVGFVVFRVLPEQGVGPRPRDLFDAGRHVPGGQREAMRLRMPARGGRLVMRTVGTSSVKVTLGVEGLDADVDQVIVPASKTWQEVSFELPKGLPSPASAWLFASDGDLFDYHLWVVEGP